MSDVAIYFLALIGAISIANWILFPVIDVLFYTVGYTVFQLWRVDWSKACKHPYALMKYTTLSLVEGVYNSSTIDQASSGDKVWKPYFHYHRKERRDIR